MKSVKLKFLELSGPIRDCIGKALSLLLYISTNKCSQENIKSQNTIHDGCPIGLCIAVSPSGSLRTQNFTSPTPLLVFIALIFVFYILKFQTLPATIWTTSLTFNNSTLFRHCIYMFCIYLITNSDLCNLLRKLVFITEMKSVYSAVLPGALNTAVWT